VKKRVDCPNVQLLCGTKDQNLTALRDALDVEITQTANGLQVAGSPKGVKRAVQIIMDFNKLTAVPGVEPDEVSDMLLAAAADPDASLFLMAGKKKPTGRARKIQPRNASQRLYMEAIEKNDLVFAIGPAGSGKSLWSVAMALQALSEKKVNKIVMVRPAVEAGERLGFLPGGMKEKIDPYLRPLYDSVDFLMRHDELEKMLAKGEIEALPVAFLRGMTFRNSFVIVDEAQNTTATQMKMILTRIGEGSKMVVTGDITQVDLPPSVTSGLIEAQRLLKGVGGIHFHEFTEADVVRHPLVQRIVNAYKEKRNE
jgi:phosphate starvation-inducible PhoH-like protein